ncbi:hypothetical protein [Propionivibrio sp.]|uniref:hypothetical protein n=1 Tax=Propionivibrio sp. TaxID=2212460 RepID=UPI003BF18FDD
MSFKHSIAASCAVFLLAVFAAPAAFADCGNSELCRVAGVQGVVKDNLLPAHIFPSRDSKAKFNLREGDEVRNRSCESHQGEYWCKVELPNNSYEFGWVLERYLRESGSGYSPHSGGTSMEYKRGYNDGLKGSQFDTYRHPQDYKDGFRDGEEARRGSGSNSYSGGSRDEHDINRLSNGGFEVVWPKRGCIASYNRNGDAMSFNRECDDNLISRSNTIAKRER